MQTSNIVPFASFVASTVTEIEEGVASLIERCLETLQHRDNRVELAMKRQVAVEIPQDLISSGAYGSAVLYKTKKAFDNAGWRCVYDAGSLWFLGSSDTIPTLSSIVAPVRKARIDEYVALIKAAVQERIEELAENHVIRVRLDETASVEYTLSACDQLKSAGWDICFDTSTLEVLLRSSTST
jgi:hypothetical protein